MPCLPSRTNRNSRRFFWGLVAGWLSAALLIGTSRAGEVDAAAPLLTRFCTECHGAEAPEAHVNLQQLSARPQFATQFRTWEKVIAQVKEGKMPPPDAEQPSETQRNELVEAVARGLDAYVKRHAGQPGRVAMRRLTSAEYAYSLEDLTGQQLIDPQEFVSDAVGGEGFTNVGDVQFVQDATLERYLEAAKKVASHAVIGAGPLSFGADPGKTGRELSAILRIQQIYRSHGFRTAAGEGGEPFGLALYPKAFYVAWRFRHRQALGQDDATLAELARQNGLEPRFAEYIRSILTAPESSFPTSDIITQWHGLPGPDKLSERDGAHRMRSTLRAAAFLATLAGLGLFG